MSLEEIIKEDKRYTEEQNRIERCRKLGKVMGFKKHYYALLKRRDNQLLLNNLIME